VSYQITSSPSFQPYTNPQVCIPLYARRASAFSSGSLRMFVVLTLLYLVVRRFADLVFTTDVFNSALRRLAETLPYTTQDVRTFIAERRQSELLFLRLPSPAEPLAAPNVRRGAKTCCTPALTLLRAPSRTRKVVYPAMSWLKRWDVCEKFPRFIRKTFPTCWACAPQSSPLLVRLH
jgi:hypothetical protein